MIRGEPENEWPPLESPPAGGFYVDWLEQLVISQQNDGLDPRIGIVLSLAKAIYDEAEKVGQENNAEAGGPSHAFGLYKIPEHHMIRLGGMLYNGTTE